MFQGNGDFGWHHGLIVIKSRFKEEKLKIKRAKKKAKQSLTNLVNGEFGGNGSKSGIESGRYCPGVPFSVGASLHVPMPLTLLIHH